VTARRGARRTGAPAEWGDRRSIATLVPETTRDHLLVVADGNRTTIADILRDLLRKSQQVTVDAENTKGAGVT
jgi:hypothetical protein